MIHRTKDGKVLLLAEIQDSHLLNIINLLLRELAMAKSVLTEEVKQNKFDEALYGEKMDPELAQDFVATFDRKVAPYIVEALIRGLSVASEMQTYRDIIGRSSRISISARARLELIHEEMSYGIDEEDDDDED